MMDRDNTTRTGARTSGVGGVFRRMAVHHRVRGPAQYGLTDVATRCTKGEDKPNVEQRMPGAGLSWVTYREGPA